MVVVRVCNGRIMGMAVRSSRPRTWPNRTETCEVWTKRAGVLRRRHSNYEEVVVGVSRDITRDERSLLLTLVSSVTSW